jgi:predicted GNAT family N-acyltransferase
MKNAPLIELLDWERARGQAAPIRFAVFVEEQGVPFEIELDEYDTVSIHALAFDGEKAVGTGRLLPDGHIGRMAVLKRFRGKGIGGALLEALMKAAKARGDREVVLSAQVDALRFYGAHGFQPEGDEYMEAGIRHQAMKRTL